MSTSDSGQSIAATDVFTLSPAARRGQLILKFRDQKSVWFSQESVDALFRGERAPSTPIVFDQSGGGRAVDFVAGGSVEIQFMSPLMIEILRSHGFTGWQTWPAEVHGKDGVLLPGYQGLAVTGRCGGVMVDRLTRDEVQRRLSTRGTMVKLDATWYDLSQWSGHDFFSPVGTTFVFVTRRVHEVLRRSGLQGVLLKPLADVEVVVFATGLPDHLRDLVREL